MSVRVELFSTARFADSVAEWLWASQRLSLWASLFALKIVGFPHRDAEEKQASTHEPSFSNIPTPQPQAFGERVPSNQAACGSFLGNSEL